MASKCRSCGREIEWAYTESGRHIPVDPEPVVGGNITLDKSSRPFEAHIIKRGQDFTRELALWDGGDKEHRYISHFATCPDASYWRKSTSEED